MLLKAWVIPLLYLDFEIRRDYIVANLCENRDRPQLNCNGKCYLAKKIAFAKKQEQKQAENNFLSRLIDFTAESPTRILFRFEASTFAILDTPLFNFFSRLKNRDILHQIFHPPTLA